MCGIVGYVGQGQRNASDVLMEGLHRLEYRGLYDAMIEHQCAAAGSAGGLVYGKLQHVLTLKCSGIGEENQRASITECAGHRPSCQKGLAFGQCRV